jgi:hypothetical protein
VELLRPAAVHAPELQIGNLIHLPTDRSTSGCAKRLDDGNAGAIALRHHATGGMRVVPTARSRQTEQQSELCYTLDQQRAWTSHVLQIMRVTRNRL